MTPATASRLLGPNTSRPNESNPRSCGECALCCTVLRVDELGKPGGIPCRNLRSAGGCAIYDTRPGICRGYRCLWLQGGLDPGDRPDRLGAVVDLLSVGEATRLSIQEAEADAFDRSPRLQEIAGLYRESIPVRIVAHGNESDPDRPFRVLLPSGEEQHVRGEEITTYRDGARVGVKRLPWFERLVRRLVIAIRGRRLQRRRQRH